MELKDKTALVTGASRGIGKAIAIRLGAMGATVIGTATSSQGAENISEYLQQSNIAGAGMVLDVQHQQNISDFIQQLNERWGAANILVNNAGITQDNLLMRMKTTQWDEVINTNLSAVYHLSKACLKAMARGRWGRVINVSSVVGSMGNAGQSNYAASKAGIEGFSRALAKEMGARNITVNSVAPGFIDTDMTKDLPEQNKAMMLQQIPVGRLGRPEEIAAAVGFLATDDAAYITGVTLQVNGGMYM